MGPPWKYSRVKTGKVVALPTHAELGHLAGRLELLGQGLEVGLDVLHQPFHLLVNGLQLRARFLEGLDGGSQLPVRQEHMAEDLLEFGHDLLLGLRVGGRDMEKAGYGIVLDDLIQAIPEQAFEGFPRFGLDLHEALRRVLLALGALEYRVEFGAVVLVPRLDLVRGALSDMSQRDGAEPFVQVIERFVQFLLVDDALDRILQFRRQQGRQQRAVAHQELFLDREIGGGALQRHTMEQVPVCGDQLLAVYAPVLGILGLEIFGQEGMEFLGLLALGRQGLAVVVGIGEEVVRDGLDVLFHRGNARPGEIDVELRLASLLDDHPGRPEQGIEIRGPGSGSVPGLGLVLGIGTRTQQRGYFWIYFIGHDTLPRRSSR